MRSNPSGSRRLHHLRVPVCAEEAAIIETQARAAGLSVAAYLRALGTGHEPRAAVDHERVTEMLRINGDLGRLGGLLKMWLADDAKLDVFDRGQVRQAILAAVRRIEETQTELRAVVQRALRGP